MKSKSIIILFLSATLLSVGCAQNSADMEHDASVSAIGDQRNTAAEEDVSSAAADPFISGDDALLPDFLYGYLDYGVYKNPPGISNPDNDGAIRLSEENRLDFPELSVLAAVVNKWGASPYLLEQSDAKIEHLFDLMKGLEIQKEIRAADMLRASEQDAGLSIVSLTAGAGYTLITLRSYKDDSIDIRIEQENESDSLTLSARSDLLHNDLREICDLQSGDIQLLANAVNIKYLTRQGGWKVLSNDQTAALKALADKMTKIQNYSTGCPFDLKLLIEADGGTYHAAISTDSCGVFIVEDQTYQLEQTQREALRTIFTEASWDGS